MVKNLVIVESPAKAKTIEKFLGKDFTVRSCYGHIRDLAKGDDAIDIKNSFKPSYTVPDEKKQVVAELKKLSKQADTIWLASDEDREGEAISWHLSEVLELDDAKTRRIVFHEITKPAILKAIENPRKIDKHLVDAQQARRVLDRLVGYELSPVLWKKIKGNLSAGRVQSVAVRLIVEREREINHFQVSSAYKVSAQFNVGGKIMHAELPKRFETMEQADAFLQKCNGADFTIRNLEVKPARKSPAPPFTTSTLQQEASRKLGYSVTQTMSVAQKLYEAGFITYMRTDSVNLSDLALGAARKQVTDQYGNEYAQTRKYTTKSASAQEAHEAIRPTYFENAAVEGSRQEQKLYELIWKRALASQMADAQLERTVAAISISTTPEELVATGEVLKFEGFLKVYLESNDNEDDQQDESSSMLPPLKVGETLSLKEMDAVQKFTRPAARYTEASLVKKLEELGIGRPSTYAPTITTIQKRGYVVREDREGKERQFHSLVLANGKIERHTKTEKYGTEKSKLFPSDIGMIVTDFLSKHFDNIMDYNFTATVEKEFDEIAHGQMRWNKMIETFYAPFHKDVENTTEHAERQSGERTLGTDPVSGKTVYAKVGRFGPFVQLGEGTETEKPQYGKLRPGQLIESITLDESLELFKLPRAIGEFEGKEIKANVGRFGPYLLHDGKFYSIPKPDDAWSVDETKASDIIVNKREVEANKLIKEFEVPNADPVRLLNGRWGPYLAQGRNNYKLPKGKDAATMTLDECLAIISAEPKTNSRFGKKAEAAPKKAAPKKVAAKKAAAKKTTAKKAAPKKAAKKK